MLSLAFAADLSRHHGGHPLLHQHQQHPVSLPVFRGVLHPFAENWFLSFPLLSFRVIIFQPQ